MYKFLDLTFQNNMVREEIEGVIFDSIDQSKFIGGENVESFEQAFANFLGAKHCIGVANGTDALELCFETLNLPKNSEVIVPANSFFATSEAVVRSGLKVVFCDVDPNSALLNIDLLEGLITEKTSAIISVHLYGNPCDMDAIRNLCIGNKLYLIEDCAQAHGAEYKGQKVGTFGDMAAFSFYPGKNLGGIGDGGAVVTGSDRLSSRCRKLANHGRISKYNHEIIGRNSRLDAINAGILEIKLKYLPSWIAHRNRLAAAYRETIKNDSIFMFQSNKSSYHSNHLFVVKTPNRKSFINFLTAHSIEYGIHYPIALHKLSAHNSEVSQLELPVSEMLADCIISLPMGEHLTVEEVIQIGNIINDFKI